MPIIINPQLGWTLLQLRTEFLRRGFDYFPADRANLYVNTAYQELCGMELWPFLENTTTGPPPLTVPDLGTLRTVKDTVTGQPLQACDLRDLVEQWVDVTQTGSPWGYYLEQGKLKTFPVGGTLEVRYYLVPANLAGDTDQAVVPDRHCMLIVNIAVRLALLDDNDAGDQQAVQAEITAGLDRMRQDLLWPDAFDSPVISMVAGADDSGWVG